LGQEGRAEAILLAEPRGVADLKEDSALVSRARAGDARAFDQLHRKYRNQVYTLCLNLCGDREEARDLLQETFMRAWRGLPRFAGRSAFSTWLHRIALNVCRDAARQRRREPKSPPEAVPARDNLPTAEQVRSVLRRLRPAHRLVLVLHYSQSLSQREIAERLNWSLARVRMTLYRARRAFREAYLPADEDQP